MRRLGLSLDTFSIRAPSDAERDAHGDEGASTYTVLSQPLRAFAGTHVRALVGRPGRYLRTLRAALSHRPPGIRALALGLAHFAEAVLLARELERRGITHLHNHFANSAATVGYLASRFAQLSWSFTMHGISETDYPAGLTLGRKIEAASAVMCASWFVRAQGMRLVEPEHWPKMQLVRCGLLFDELSEPLPIVQRRPVLLCIGRLSPEKGQAGLLEAFAGLTKASPDLLLHFVGDGPDRDRLEQAAVRFGISERVRFLGRLSESDTLAALKEARLLVLPSFMEGLPIVLLEAAAFCVPVIASRVAGVPELIEEGISGKLFSPGHWDELRACIDQVIADSDGGFSMAAALRGKVLKEFDVRRSAGKLVGIYDELSRSSAPRTQPLRPIPAHQAKVKRHLP